MLQEKQRSITRKRNEQLVGKVVEVLVEGPSKRNREHLTGRSGTNRVVNFAGHPNLTGELVEVRVLTAHAHSLFGRVV